MRNWNIKICKHKPNSIPVSDHVLFCNYSTSYKILVFWLVSTKRFVHPANYETTHQLWEANHLCIKTFHWHHCTYCTIPALGIRSLLEFDLLILVAELPLLNGSFEWYFQLSFFVFIEHYFYHELWFSYRSTFILIYLFPMHPFSTSWKHPWCLQEVEKEWIGNKWLVFHHQSLKMVWISTSEISLNKKVWIFQTSCDLFTLN